MQSTESKAQSGVRAGVFIPTVSLKIQRAETELRSDTEESHVFVCVYVRVALKSHTTGHGDVALWVWRVVR